MTSSPFPRPPEATRRLGDRPQPQWQTWVPLGLVVLSLLALAILPGAVARRTARLQSEVAERVTPVRNELHAFGLAFAREVLAFRAWALTGDTGFADEFKRSAEDADRSLDAVARKLSGTDLAPLAAELRSTLGGWREMVRQIMESQIGRADPLADLSNQQRRVNAVLELSTRLDRRLGGWEEATARLTQSESRRQALVSLFLAMVALTATVAVAMLSVQSRRQARQLRYRAQEERALRDVARTLSAAVTVNEVAQRVVQAAVETTRGFGAYVEEARVEDVEVVAVEGQGGPPLGTRAPFPGSLTDAALHSGEATVVMEIGAIGESMAPYLQGRCHRCTGLVVPLMGGTEVLGALVILRSSAQETFGPNELRHAQALGDLVSSALRRVTLLEQTERERKEKTALLESTAQGMWGMDGDGCATFLNSAAALTLGFTPEEVLGRPVHALFHHTRPDGTSYPESQCPMTRVMTTRERVLIAGELLWRKDGTSFLADYSAAPIVIGEVQGAVVAFTDATARHRREREIRESEERFRALAESERAAREGAETAVRTRDEVLAIVSHDLRNPLNTIALAVGALESGDVPAAEETRTIQVVRRAVDRMNRLIADLLDVAKLEAGQKLAIQPEALDIRSVITETCDGLAAEAERKRQHLDCHLDQRLPKVTGDKHRLIQVLANLVGNALKFSGEEGHVTVTATTEDGNVVVSVTDTGPGIAPEHLAQVFNPYWQARQTARLGAGLGLAIAKGIVEAHGGRIWATSAPGGGSTFAFSLPPLAQKPAETAASKDAAARS
ncbi:MAG TPA: ATP-binding protein [Vicinamibacteria bacterium]|nr:ATP-binding protein [Vicinamibacteria bacterium]